MTEATKGRGCKFSPNMDTLSGAFIVDDAADHRCEKSDNKSEQSLTTQTLCQICQISFHQCSVADHSK